MKKLILTIAGLVYMMTTSYGQDTETKTTVTETRTTSDRPVREDLRERLLFGLKVGANLSNVYDSQEDDFDTDPKIGLATGAFLSVPIGRYLGIQPEILYSQKGFFASGRVTGNDYDLTRTLHSVDVPIYVAFKPAQFLTILAGPQYSFLFKNTDKFSNSRLTVQQETDFNNEDLRKNIFGVIGGADFNIGHVVLGARAGFDIQDNHSDGSVTTPRYKNVWYQATFGYRFY